MRKQTKKMLQVLQETDSITGFAAQRKGITNPRLEVGLLRSREGFNVSITRMSEKKREYKLLG